MKLSLIEIRDFCFRQPKKKRVDVANPITWAATQCATQLSRVVHEMSGFLEFASNTESSEFCHFSDRGSNVFNDQCKKLGYKYGTPFYTEVPLSYAYLCIWLSEKTPEIANVIVECKRNTNTFRRLGLWVDRLIRDPEFYQLIRNECIAKRPSHELHHCKEEE